MKGAKTRFRSLTCGQDVIVLDVSGAIITPGFVDTHRHAWETQLRRIMPDVDDLGGYVTTTLMGYAPAYRPQDMYVGTKLAALTAIDSGVTTMLDFSHNSRSTAHSDQAVQALLDTGIRGIHAAMGPHFGDWDRQWPADVARLQKQHDSKLLTFRLATLPTGEIAGPIWPSAGGWHRRPGNWASASASTLSSALPPRRRSWPGSARACSARTSP
ncbi:amidohydrolase family protein [Plantactinospora sp. BB1]|uniref:amidohydrolase family protein n=1 Tax=Plantactinospora sp. BB1 TaxID=2071627 RepID=UPI001F2776D5|nr:amidohydrolase family protein [Plantactinospora sp. BB1]